jgi:hypothetical protein
LAFVRTTTPTTDDTTVASEAIPLPR